MVAVGSLTAGLTELKQWEELFAQSQLIKKTTIEVLFNVNEHRAEQYSSVTDEIRNDFLKNCFTEKTHHPFQRFAQCCNINHSIRYILDIVKNNSQHAFHQLLMQKLHCILNNFIIAKQSSIKENQGQHQRLIQLLKAQTKAQTFGSPKKGKKNRSL